MKIRDILNKDTATISFEVFPPKKSTDFGNVEAAALGIAALQPAYMSVTYGAGGSTKGHTIALAGEIQKQHNVPTVAHLTCVCADRGSIGTALTEMQAAGIENILALRGDIPKDFDGEVFTDFTHASDLVRFIKKTEISAWVAPATRRCIPILLTKCGYSGVEGEGGCRLRIPDDPDVLRQQYLLQLYVPCAGGRDYRAHRSRHHAHHPRCTGEECRKTVRL